MRSAIAALGLFVVPAVVSAHHSRIDFNTSAVVEMEGELIEVRWRLPHPSFTLLVEGPDGENQSWELEGSGLYGLERSGLGEDSFPVGERVRIAGWRSKSRPMAMFVTNMLLPGGRELVLLASSAVSNRWSDDYAGGQWISDTVGSGRDGIFRVWSAESRDVFFQASLGIEVELTEAAKAKMTDSADLDPCMPQGMPAVMVNSLPVELVDRGDHIELRLTTFGVIRRIDMTGRPSTEAIPATDLGYSAGRWVDDNTLEVRTTRVSWPYFDDAGRPQTERVEILERFSLGDRRDRLEYAMTVTDPASFTEPVTLNWHWIDIGEEIVLFDTCPGVN